MPELASREHGRWLGPLFDALLTEAGIEAADLDCIAVARGPGLLGSLLCGTAFAKGLALALSRPLLGINHLHAHLLAAGLAQELVFPALGLVISGGHTEIYRIESPSRFMRLGRTLDDAAGETFDKVGKGLGLRYPAGREIDNLARTGNAAAFPLPLPYTHNDNLDFSFSGLKTAALNYSRELKPDQIGDLCAALNEAVAETLLVKVNRALEGNRDLNALYLAGGVAANSLIRKRMEDLMQRRNGRLLVPPVRLCMDNGAMIAYTGYLLAKSGYHHRLDLEAIPRGRKIPDDMLAGAPCR